MEWLKALFGKTRQDDVMDDDSLGPMEKRALELCETGVQQLESGNVTDALITFSKSLSYCGRTETYLHRATAFCRKGELQSALSHIELGLDRRIERTPVSVINQLQALKKSVNEQISSKTVTHNSSEVDPHKLIRIATVFRGGPRKIWRSTARGLAHRQVRRVRK